MTPPLLLAINSDYFGKFLSWRNIAFEPAGSLYKIPGFDDYNHLLDVNKVFSTFPHGDLIDRTNTLQWPYKFATARSWSTPTKELSLEDFFKQRVEFYINQNSVCNICWSGGIDSSAMLSAFLQHTTNFDQLRILYSPYSVYENKTYYQFLQSKFPQVKLIDISGDVYLNTKFDGIMINGHGGDEFTASLDESFHATAHEHLHRPWADYFQQSNTNSKFLEFCEQFFKSANTLLEARWWFYAALKSQIFSVRDNLFVQQQATQTDIALTSSFFDCDEFESFVYFNIDKIIDDTSDYKTYKKFLRRYTYKFNNDSDHLLNAAKSNSHQFLYYINKMMCLQDKRWLFKLSDGAVVRTPNLPLLSKKEFQAEHGSTLDYLFNFS
jgi:hypothetical protein